ncbi:uncharacterized protein LOC123505391 [Portunus trituberculatus]|uniref:uncharacterized protein LOC123505391 n=1 Tax=Portunus trituberculatus TaxID=210409 RepID=UPI001E1CCC6E|nr:uncharacterized protein LOC123505391 [Portunus trituberculatus]
MGRMRVEGGDWLTEDQYERSARPLLCGCRMEYGLLCWVRPSIAVSVYLQPREEQDYGTSNFVGATYFVDPQDHYFADAGWSMDCCAGCVLQSQCQSTYSLARSRTTAPVTSSVLRILSMQRFFFL